MDLYYSFDTCVGWNGMLCWKHDIVRIMHTVFLYTVWDQYMVIYREFQDTKSSDDPGLCCYTNRETD